MTKTTNDLPELTYTGVRISKLDHVHISAVIDELAEQKVDHTVLLRHAQGTWEANGVKSASCGMWPIGPDSKGLINVGIDGNVVEFSFPGRRSEHVDQSENGPSRLVHLKAVEKIGDHIYAAGMARHVYRRRGRNSWESMDAGVFVPRNQRTRACGFLAIGGPSENEIYAVGLDGEVWFFDGNKWSKEESPTNVALTCLSILDTGEICIAGLAGVLISGRTGRWKVIQQDLTSKDFWGCAEFRGKIYLANYEGVFVLNEDLTDLEPVNLGLGDSFTTAYLDARDGVIWSVGHKHLAFSLDGLTWTEVMVQGASL